MTAVAEQNALLTVKQAADQLAIPRSAIYRLLMGGSLTSVKIGRHRRVPAWAIDEYVRRLVEEQSHRIGSS